jgi:hypothetical protein
MPDPKEVQALLERVRNGNNKMMAAVQQTIKLDSSTPEGKALWKANMDKITEASATLRGLCDQLKMLGFLDCLYIEKGKKTRLCGVTGEAFCQVCPSAIPYWEKEIFEAALDKPAPAKAEVLVDCINEPAGLCSRRGSELKGEPCTMKPASCGYLVKKPAPKAQVSGITLPKRKEETIVLF